MRGSGPLAIIAAAVLWGTAGTAGTLALGAGVDADSLDLAAARLVIGGLVLGATLIAGARARLTGLGRSMPLAMVAVLAYQICFFAAVDRTGVAIGTVVAIGSGPVFTGLLSWLFDRTRPSRAWAAATATAIAGCALLLAGGGVDSGRDVTGGVLIALLGGLLYAFYVVTAARAINRGAPSGLVMGVMFAGAGVLAIPLLAVGGVAWLAEPYGLATALYLGCATTALAYVLYGRGLRTTPVASAATLALAEPAVAALLGLIVLDERLPALSWAGMALLGLALVAVARATPAEPADPASGTTSAATSAAPSGTAADPAAAPADGTVPETVPETGAAREAADAAGRVDESGGYGHPRRDPSTVEGQA